MTDERSERLSDLSYVNATRYALTINKLGSYEAYIIAELAKIVCSGGRTIADPEAISALLADILDGAECKRPDEVYFMTGLLLPDDAKLLGEWTTVMKLARRIADVLAERLADVGIDE